MKTIFDKGCGSESGDLKTALIVVGLCGENYTTAMLYKTLTQGSSARVQTGIG